MLIIDMLKKRAGEDSLKENKIPDDSMKCDNVRQIAQKYVQGILRANSQICICKNMKTVHQRKGPPTEPLSLCSFPLSIKSAGDEARDLLSVCVSLCSRSTLAFQPPQ